MKAGRLYAAAGILVGWQKCHSGLGERQTALDVEDDQTAADAGHEGASSAGAAAVAVSILRVPVKYLPHRRRRHHRLLHPFLGNLRGPYVHEAVRTGSN